MTVCRLAARIEPSMTEGNGVRGSVFRLPSPVLAFRGALPLNRRESPVKELIIMVINGHRVIKTRVQIKVDDLHLTFYGASARGTPLMLAGVLATRPMLRDMLVAITAKGKAPTTGS